MLVVSLACALVCNLYGARSESGCGQELVDLVQVGHVGWFDPVKVEIRIPRLRDGGSEGEEGREEREKHNRINKQEMHRGIGM